MHGPVSFASSHTSYELIDKKGASVQVHDVDPSNDQHPMLQPGSPPPAMMTEPDTLEEERQYEILYDLYDTFLCLLAFMLIVKTSLVVYANSRDQYNRGLLVDQVSPLTLNLIQFNEQVSLKRAGLRGYLC